MSATPVSYEPTPVSRLCGPVLVADRRSTRVRRTRDLIDTTLALLAIVLVIFIGAFAQSTTVAVTEDVRSALSGVLRQILLLPLTLVESVVVLAAPIFIIVQLAIHGRLRQIVETIITTTVTALLMTALISAGPHLPSEITGPLTITSITSTYLALDTLIAVLAAFLTSASEASESKAVRYTWIFLYAMAFIYVLRGTLTLPSALVTLLIGRAIGLLSRYVLGYREERGVSTPVGLATVALIQFTQFATTVITLLLIILVTGRSTTLEIPSGTLVYVIGTVVTIVAIILVIPKLRNMIWEKIQPSWNQIWERLVWVASQPKRLAIGVLGNLVMTVSYVAAFGASLAAFGYSLDVTTLAITFLASTSLGSVIPAPGGIGPVEAALTAGLTVAGIPSGIAISTALVYRLVTFYARAPLGWIALRILQRRNLI